jgi:AraC-like DNA-binding protein
MSSRNEKMNEFKELCLKFAPEEGIYESHIENVVAFRTTENHKPKPMLYEQGVIFCANGRKNITLEGRSFGYQAGEFLALMVPMPLECELVNASKEDPMLGFGIFLDPERVSRILLKMDKIMAVEERRGEGDTSGIFKGRISDKMLESIIRLLRISQNECEAAVLADGILDEIYFRILSEEQGGALRNHLQQRGQIRQISRAVEHLHQNLDQPVSVDDLARIVHMSASGFHKKFKEVMHLSPLQYAKSIKLSKAKGYILDGKSVSEAGYMVGYNSAAQFSREFKRFFGVVPSEALA